MPTKSSSSRKRVPRSRGDEPLGPVGQSGPIPAFPARVGMNRSSNPDSRPRGSVPRSRGDDPRPVRYPLTCEPAQREKRCPLLLGQMLCAKTRQYARARPRHATDPSHLHGGKGLEDPSRWPHPLDPARATLHKEAINDVSWVDFRGPLQRCHNTGLRTDFFVPSREKPEPRNVPRFDAPVSSCMRI